MYEINFESINSLIFIGGFCRHNSFSKKDLNTLINYTRLTFFYMVSINYKYSNKINYFRKIFPE